MRALPMATAPHPVDASYLLHEQNIISSTIDQGHGQNTSKSQLWTKKRGSGLGVEVVLRHFQSTFKGNLSKLPPHPLMFRATLEGSFLPDSPCSPYDPAYVFFLSGVNLDPRDHSHRGLPHKCFDSDSQTSLTTVYRDSGM